MERPILCFDLDGTLLHPGSCSDSSVHPQDVGLLSMPEPPALFIPATGRSLESVRRTFAQNRLFVGEKIPLPMVLQNGALLYMPDEVQAAYFHFPKAVQEQLIHLARDFPQITFLLLNHERIHLLNPSPFGLEQVEKYEYEVQEFETSSQTAYSKIMGISDQHAALEALAQAGKRLPVEGAYSLPIMYEFNPQGVSKAWGVKVLLEHMGRANAPFYAAGDSGNDRLLLEAARLAFAPATSHPDIQKLADYVLDVYQGGLLAPMLDVIAGLT